ncbi:transporter [Limnohabitans sp. TS-CS-82]|jgi:osmotically-inducible protein OsmY|uniref:BON domain-containing protein n=1 Tax=Limnohabitans sp. TS-CS-82 TaxID=2094193 RepID=UPI000CF22FF0|nr:BON domain-containing protein [Limnohabitans sp. TS-CS-82]PQA81903.1 transporter [Limnohabitans sp. TS-CS-82]
MTMKNTSQKLLAVLALSLGLSACAPVMIGGMMGGAMVASDRRTTGIQLEDEGIEQRSATARDENFGTKEHVNFTSYNRQVLLTGEVSSDRIRQQMEQLIGRVENVRLVANELAVGPASSFGDRSNDVLLVAKVKAAMVDSEDVFANVFKVVAERGTVYLMGRVTQREATRATEVVRGVSGVKRVVKVFEYITEDELRAMHPNRTPSLESNSKPVSLAPPANSGAVVTPIK